MSLASCIKNIGSFEQEDLAILEEAYDKHIKDGLSESEAAQQAAEEYLSVINTELNNLRSQLELEDSVITEAEFVVDQKNIDLVDNVKALPEYKNYIKSQEKLKKLTKEEAKKDQTRISESLSWFLTAYVDIAKDPYITRGNHNSVTSNVVFMLIRNGTPLKWVNRLVGQESIMRYAELELNKNSKFNPSRKNSFINVESDIINKLKQISKLSDKEFPKYYKAISDKLENIGNLGNSIRNNPSFKTGYMETQIKSKVDKIDNLKYWESQLEYLYAFKAYNELGKKFNDTVIYSKADVNGSPSSVSSLYEYIRGYVNTSGHLNDEDEYLFMGFAEKFSNTFLGSTHRNSINVADKIFEKEMVTYSAVFGKKVLESFYDANNKKANFKSEFAALESHLYGYIASKSSFFNMDSTYVESLFKGNDTMQSKVMAAREQYKDNLLLNTLIPFTQQGLQFISIDNLTNKPNSYKDDLMRAWDDLQEVNPDLSEDLLRYSYVTSNFNFNSQSFFEFAPHHLIKTVLEGTVNHFKNDNSASAYIEDFFETYSRNNSDKVTEFKFKNKKDKSGYSPLNNTEFSNNLIIGQGEKVTGARYIKTSSGLLFKLVGKSDADTFVYQKVGKLGYSNKGYYIYENSLNEPSMFEANKIKISEKIQSNVNNYINDMTKWDNSISDVNIEVDKINYMSSSGQELEEALQRGIDSGLFQEKCD